MQISCNDYACGLVPRRSVQGEDLYSPYRAPGNEANNYMGEQRCTSYMDMPDHELGKSWVCHLPQMPESVVL